MFIVTDVAHFVKQKERKYANNTTFRYEQLLRQY